LVEPELVTRQSKPLSILIYGQSGIGKTVLSSTAPKPLFLDLEEGLLSVVDRGVSRIKVESGANLADAYTWLKEKNNNTFQTVVLDSLSELQRVLISEFVKQLGLPTADLRVWGLVLDKMWRIVKSFKQLPLHFIATSTVKSEKDEVTGIIVQRPSFSGQFSEQVALYFDEVFYMDLVEKEEGKSERVLFTQPRSHFFAKDRSGKLDPIEIPDLNSIFKKIQGGNSNES